MTAKPDRDPVTLLGRAVDDRLVTDWLRFHGETRPFHVIEGVCTTYGEGFGKTGGFCLSAEPAVRYRRDVGEPLSSVTGDENEMIVRGMFFTNAGCAVPGSTAYPHPLPFGLVFGDLADLVSRKLGVEPIQKIKSGNLPDHSPVRFSWSWNVGRAFLYTGLTESLTLASINMYPVDRLNRAAREREASLEAESANIDPANVGAVEALRGSIPTPRWRQAMEDGDELFTDAIITEATDLLNRFVDEVKSATKERSAPKVFAATKRLTLDLNALNEAKSAIETLERDELGVFMDAVVRATGFKLKDGEDLTLQWREW